MRKHFGAPLVNEHQPFLSTDDQKDAYRMAPIAPNQLGFSVVAFMDPHKKCMVFAIAYALLFGLSASVNDYYRIPSFLVAFCRRAFATASWHFFDDVARVILASEGD
eukprot:12406209-Karenia_brevis.AAC.1